MEFYNRSTEIAQLTEVWGGLDDRRSFIVVYGRRRCGKSTLLRKLLRSRDVYFMATEGDPSLQRRLFARALADRFPAFDAVTYTDYDQLFRTLTARTDAPFTLVIDEFPYLIRNDPSLASILQRQLDDPATRTFNLVLCGSSQQMMHDAVLAATAPLYGRADEILKIAPLEAGWLTEAFPELSPPEILREYAVWGGVPRYWETRRRFSSLATTVERTLLTTTGLFYDEAERLLRDDLRDLAQPIAILNTIAQGVHRPSEIGARLNRKASDLYRSLTRLVQLGYIQREIPLLTPVQNTKLTHYRLSDPFLRFYYRFIIPNASAIGAGTGRSVWDRIDAEFPAFAAQTWEDLCRRAVLRGLIGPGFTQAGRWWGKDSTGKFLELDVLATNPARSEWAVIECKWGRIERPDRLRERLEQRVRKLPFYNGTPVRSYVAGAQGQGQDDSIHPAQVLRLLR